MATESPRKRLRCEATCSICLDYFVDPVMLPCTHSFCQKCITYYSKDSGTDLRCPQCCQFVKKDFKPNRTLMAISEISQQMDFSMGIWPNCETHQEPLKLFCKDDGTLLCATDNVPEEHEDHAVVPVDYAVQEYKFQILNCLKTLKKERASITKSMEELKDKTKNLCFDIDSNKSKITVELRMLRLFLKRQENILIQEMEEAQDTIERTKGNYLAFFSDELTHLEEFIRAMEEAYQKPPAQLLKGAKIILQRYEKKLPFQLPVFEKDVSKWTESEFHDKTVFVKGTAQQFKDNWRYGLILQQGGRPGTAIVTRKMHNLAGLSFTEVCSALPACLCVDVILDPATAHPNLILSEDGRNVRHRGDNSQGLAENMEGSDERPSVLGRQVITEGRHCWDILLASEGDWALGVLMKSSHLIPDGSYIWQIGKWQGKYKASNPPYYYNRDLYIKREPEKIRVSLNCEGGRVAFYDVDSGALLTAFASIPFCGQQVFPFFEVAENGHLTICPGRQ